LRQIRSFFRLRLVFVPTSIETGSAHPRAPAAPLHKSFALQISHFSNFFVDADASSGVRLPSIPYSLQGSFEKTYVDACLPQRLFELCNFLLQLFFPCLRLFLRLFNPGQSSSLHA
jgi:hypothetical protein